MSLSALVLYHPDKTRYSIHALAGALETDPRFDHLPIYFPEREQLLLDCLKELTAGGIRGENITVALTLFTSQMRHARAFAARIRAAAPGVFLLGGGPHASGAPANALAAGFDAVVIGEGEETFPDLLSKLQTDEDWRATPGIASLGPGGELCRTPARPLVDLDRFPPFPVRLQRFGHIEITRGCPFACAFCQVSHMHGGRPRHRGLEAVLRAVGAMRRGGRIDYRFITPNAFGYGSPDGRAMNLDAVRDFLREIRAAAGPEGRIYFGSFPSEVRPEHVNEETVALVKQYCNNNNIIIGAQSGSNRMLAECHRGHTIEDVFRAAACIRKAGLQANVDFIFGLPGETGQDMLESIDAMRRLAAQNVRIHTHTFMPVPQTLFQDAPAGRVHPRILDLLNQQLIPNGQAYGNWKEQVHLANENRKASE